MTDRAEIERLLNQTGRTLEGLPTEEGYLSADDCAERYRDIELAKRYGKFKCTVPFMLYQSDVIELLVGALRDALEKPMQKPMELYPDKGVPSDDMINMLPIFIECRFTGEIVGSLYNTKRDMFFFDDEDGGFWRDNEGQGRSWRCWACRPTDEEREAAAWEI